MVEFAYVIQRDDGKFFCTTKGWKNSCRKAIYDSHLIYANKEWCKSDAEETIKIFNLQNCKVIKIKVEVVEE